MEDVEADFSYEIFLISRAAFDAVERAKHWTAFHVAQTIPTDGTNLVLLDGTTLTAAFRARPARPL